VSDRTELAPAYLICGSDLPKVRRAVERLRRRVFEETSSDLNITLLDARSQSAGAVVEVADTPTFTLGTRLVLVSAADKWPVAERERIAVYLDDPAPGVCIALVGDSFKKTERLTRLLEKRKAVLRFDLPKKYELSGWVREHAKARRAHLGAGEARYLIAQVGADAQLLESEVTKLATYARGAPITIDDIDAVCSPTIEARIYELTDAVGRRDGAAAFRILENLFATAGRSGDEVARSTIWSLVKYVGQLGTVLDLPQEMPPDEVARTVGVAPYTARKLCEQRERFDRRMLDRATVALADAQASMVGKSELEAEFVLEIALARLLGSRPARTSGRKT
jgi:DNA polymerase-3 subunit delta